MMQFIDDCDHHSLHFRVIKPVPLKKHYAASHLKLTTTTLSEMLYYHAPNVLVDIFGFDLERMGFRVLRDLGKFLWSSVDPTNAKLYKKSPESACTHGSRMKLLVRILSRYGGIPSGHSFWTEMNLPFVYEASPWHSMPDRRVPQKHPLKPIMARVLDHIHLSMQAPDTGDEYIVSDAVIDDTVNVLAHHMWNYVFPEQLHMSMAISFSLDMQPLTVLNYV